MIDETNAERAARVEGAVEGYALAHFGASNEYLHTIIQDLIADLGHLLDRPDMLAHLDCVEIDPEPTPFEHVIETAYHNYLEEVEQGERACRGS